MQCNKLASAKSVLKQARGRGIFSNVEVLRVPNADGLRTEAFSYSFCLFLITFFFLNRSVTVIKTLHSELKCSICFLLCSVFLCPKHCIRCTSAAVILVFLWLCSTRPFSVIRLRFATPPWHAVLSLFCFYPIWLTWYSGNRRPLVLFICCRLTEWFRAVLFHRDKMKSVFQSSVFPHFVFSHFHFFPFIFLWWCFCLSGLSACMSMCLCLSVRLYASTVFLDKYFSFCLSDWRPVC